MIAASISLFFVLAPAAILWLISRHSWAQRIGAIILCYSLGLLLGNSGLIPSSAQGVQDSLSELAIGLALPMLLFTLNIKQWSSMAGKAMLSLVLATASVVTVTTSLYFFYINAYPSSDALQNSQLAAMSIGVYTGGTANLAAIKSGLDIPDDLYLLFHSFDTVIGSVYLLFMLSVAIPVFRRFLGPPKNVAISAEQELDQTTPFDEDYSALLKASKLKQLSLIFALALLVLALSVFGAQLAVQLLELQSIAAVTILLITSLGISFSLIDKVRALELAYKLGMYLILVFCVVVASMADLQQLVKLDASVAIFLLGTVSGSLVLHALLCKLTRVDSDTFMVTSVSAICSPPFVPMMSKALHNPNVLLSGMTTGIIGFAIGNYLGISLALLLQNWP